MTFVTFGDDRLKISLDTREAKRLFGDGVKIDRKSPNTKLALNFLLRLAIQNRRFAPSGKRLIVDIFKNIYGGCDIYFVICGNNLSAKEETVQNRIYDYVIDFENCDNAIYAAKILSDKQIRLCESRFFKTERGYRLIISSKEEIYDKLFSVNEFYLGVYRSPVEKAKTEEYGREIISENAVSVLKRLY